MTGDKYVGWTPEMYADDITRILKTHVREWEIMIEHKQELDVKRVIFAALIAPKEHFGSYPFALPELEEYFSIVTALQTMVQRAYDGWYRTGRSKELGAECWEEGRAEIQAKGSEALKILQSLLSPDHLQNEIKTRLELRKRIVPPIRA